jgi:flavodoxin
MSKKLVVYYSFSGTTRKLAEEIASQAGADLRELVPERAYSFDYNTAVREARREIERGFCPKLASGDESIGQYDVVFIGSPNWLNRFAPPVLSFLRHQDLSQKAVAPFSTSGGGGFGRMIEDYIRECPSSRILPGLTVSAGFLKADVTKWLSGIGMLK